MRIARTWNRFQNAAAHGAVGHLEPVDVVAWREEHRYDEREGDPAIAEFERERAALIEELKALAPESLTRVGIRADGSEITVLAVIRQLAEHDQDHRWRVTAILRGYAGL